MDMDILLVGATEEQQPLAEELERAGFQVEACLLAAAAERLANGEPPYAVIVSLADEPDEAAVRDILRAEVLPAPTPAIALVRPHQVPRLDASLPVDDFASEQAPVDELVIRIRRASWRRAGADDAHLVRCGELVIDQQSYKVFVGGRPVDLTYKEYELLRFLAVNQDRVFTREALLSRVWGYDFYGGSRTVDVHIRRLRSKIEDRTHTFIETVRNVGYRFRAG
jgi:two-component system alkaline phosphatase synthesis response regulator PhoP